MSTATIIPASLGVQYRTVRIARETPEDGADDNRFAFSISSEEPGRQWFGTEVLSHAPKAIRTQRLERGVAALFNHDRDAHLGRTDKFSIKNKKLMVEGFFGPSPLAQEKKADYAAGVLVDVSIGYAIYHITRDQVGEFPSEEDTLLVDDWEPLEVSLVTVPMDCTVGVDRAVGQLIPVAVETVRRSVATPEVQPAAPAAIPVVIEVRTMPEVTQPDANILELARRDRIMAIASDKDFSKYISTDEARQAIAANTSAEAFAESVSRKIIAANEADKVGTAGSAVLADLGKDAKRYSLARAHRAAIRDYKATAFAPEDDKLEREVSAEISKRLGKTTGGLFIPNSVTRTQTASATGSGLTALTSVVGTFTEPELIEMYRNRARVLALGATRLGGLSGIIRLPRQTSAASAAWQSETTTSSVSNVTTDYVAITPKRLSMQNAYTVELLAESSVDVEGMLARDRAKVLNLAIDLASINGATGGANPVGMLQTSGLATVTSSGTALTSTGKALSYLDYLAMESVLAAANADSANAGFLVTPETRALAKGTPMFAAGYAMPIWNSNQRDPEGLETGPLGYKAGVTNQLPKNLTYSAVNNLHAAIFGDFSNLIVADYGASELIVDPFTQAAGGIYVVTERMLLDVEIRHITAFVACLTVAVA